MRVVGWESDGMPAYVIVDTLIRDAERYEEYKKLARRILY